MENMEPIVIIFLIFGGGSVVSKMWSSYNNTRIEIARIKADSQANTAGGGREAERLRAEIAALRDEVRSLRDTSMQYDISFDTALNRMDARMLHLERKVGGNTVQQSDTAEQTVSVSRSNY